jgi:hypothetical protein
MRITPIILTVGLGLSSLSAYAGRDGAQLMLLDQLNKRAAAERQKAAVTQDEVTACQASVRRACPNATSR